MKQRNWVTGRRISAVVTLAMIAFLGSLAPASDAFAGTTVASAVTHNTSHGTSARVSTEQDCLQYLIDQNIPINKRMILFCAWATNDPNTVRGVLICNNGLIWLARVNPVIAAVACGRALSPG